MYIEGSQPRIAVIGMGCWYPGARDLRQLWENILSRRRQFRESPDRRLPLADYYDPDPTVPDKTYGKRMAVIEGFEFDWASKRIPKTVVETADIAHWVALEVAIAALENSGYTRANVPGERTGVILGNSLTGEQTRSNNMRLRWPFIQRVIHAAAKAKGLPLQVIDELTIAMQEYYKSVFSPFTEDTLSGNLSNTIAGRICNFFNFHGGGYTVDGACSSSLIAVATAANALNNGDLDLALAGGVDISLDTFELVGFAKTGALTSKDMTVYDRKASGFIPGEGAGFVVLKRLEDARADNDYIYAVLNGWGISSDGKGGLTAPSREGQAKALRRAYNRAGYSLNNVDFIEGHGTGTPVGDRVELEGIALAMGANSETPSRSCGITSFKSLVGHTKAAAGIGGFIKAVMAVNRRVIPPLAGCNEPNEVFDKAAHCLYPVLQGEVRQTTETLRAGVLDFGLKG
ncbi:MAG: polyketide synthase [Nostoc sp.]|uniref:polyketide synthase n=1 Tax=Nostoc sp. TaxID=1180 RepID=UPI002FF92E9F